MKGKLTISSSQNFLFIYVPIPDLGGPFGPGIHVEEFLLPKLMFLTQG
jgi:hypothetical protein